MLLSPVTKACTITAEATHISPVRRWNRPMPPCTSGVLRRRAPASEAATAPLATTKDARIRNVPNADTLFPLARLRDTDGRGRLIAGRTLGHHPALLDLEPIGA